ncbi:MAG: DUF4250 domain-containing protein [Roseburia sp.]|nr:DUF4250 domain-containing protein [Roseburia sp.]
MTMYEKLPNDPVMLLSFINTQLRDTYESFDDFAAAFQLDGNAISEKLKQIDYVYDETANQFV